MAYDQRMQNTANHALTKWPPLTSGAVTNPGSVASGPMGAFAPPGGNPQGSVAPGGYPPPGMNAQMMGQGVPGMPGMPNPSMGMGPGMPGMPNPSMGANPALMQLAENIQNQQPHVPGSPTAGQPALGGNAIGQGMGARGAFSAPTGSARASGGRR